MVLMFILHWLNMKSGTSASHYGTQTCGGNNVVGIYLINCISGYKGTKNNLNYKEE